MNDRKRLKLVFFVYLVVDDNLMKIVVNKEEIEFKRTDFGIWNTIISIFDFSIYLQFDELIFKNSQDEINVNWDLIEKFIVHITENIKKINEKSCGLLEELRLKTVSGKTEVTKKGYFEIDGIILEDFAENIFNNTSNHDKYAYYNFLYTVDFFYEHSDSYLSNNDYYYKTKFSNHHGLSIIGVFNDIWDLYKKR